VGDAVLYREGPQLLPRLDRWVPDAEAVVPAMTEDEQVPLGGALNPYRALRTSGGGVMG
jgi:hypothetical protein